MTGPLPLKVNIPIGEHPTGSFLGMTFNLDTVWTTVIAGIIVIILGFIVRARLTKPEVDHVPSKLQIFWEMLVGQVNDQVEDNTGRIHPFLAPLAVALFIFILIANYLEIIPSQLNEHHTAHSTTHFLPAPTADPNLTYAMGILAMVGAWIYGIRKQGPKDYFRGFAEPMVLLTPLNIIEELVKPFTLALRLFGNIFAGGIMVAIIGLLVAVHPGHVPVGGFFTVVLNVVWKLFDMFIGAIQAFIFALLTVIYFGMAGTGHGGGGDHEEHHENEAAPASESAEATPQLAA